jgi:5-methylcytosine-specific restriction enzyme subunit McrC
MALVEQIQLDARLVPKFACEFDELEYDNLENRILLHTLLKCMGMTNWPELRKRTLTDIRRLESLQVKDVLKVGDIEKMQRSYTRLNDHYKQPHKICEMIEKKFGVSDFYRGTTSAIVPFFVDMPDIFEKFVQRLFEKYHEDGITVKPQLSERAWKGPGLSRWSTPDIGLYRGDKLEEIVDMKYKDKLKSSDLYQLGFYMHEYGGNEVKQAFAIMPNTRSADGPYESERHHKMVYEKRVNLDDYTELIDSNNKPELKKLVKGLTTPPAP